MDYPIGRHRCLIIILVVAYISRVADGRVVAMQKDAKQDFAVNGSSNGGGGVSGNQQSQPSWGAQNAIWSMGRETVNAAHRMLWGLGKFLLSAGETINSVWDVALNAALGLLRTGGATYHAVAAKVAGVPIFGYGAGGVGAAVHEAVVVAESNARHDMRARHDAFAALAARLDESGKRLSGGAKAPATAAAVVKSTVHFPDR